MSSSIASIPIPGQIGTQTLEPAVPADSKATPSAPKVSTAHVQGSRQQTSASQEQLNHVSLDAIQDQVSLTGRSNLDPVSTAMRAYAAAGSRAALSATSPYYAATSGAVGGAPQGESGTGDAKTETAGPSGSSSFDQTTLEIAPLRGADGTEAAQTNIDSAIRADLTAASPGLKALSAQQASANILSPTSGPRSEAYAWFTRKPA